MREAPRWHIDRLMAYIWHDNDASRGLFRSHGFAAWGSLPAWCGPKAAASTC
jgi:L-amino acid N-acyltransferase YncA